MKIIKAKYYYLILLLIFLSFNLNSSVNRFKQVNMYN